MIGPTTKWGQENPYRWELTHRVAGVLKANGTNLRPVYIGLTDLPAGGMNQVLNERPFDALRVEAGGTTVTVDITTDRTGERQQPDQVRFACYDFETFRTWFYNLLRRSGQHPAPAVTADLGLSKFAVKPRNGLRPSLTTHRKKQQGQ